MAHPSANQDLLRSAVAGIPPHDIDSRLGWLRLGGPAPRPMSVHLDLTFRCTARCAHCAQWTWQDRPDLDAEQFDSLVDTLRRWGVRTVTLGGGNPLLHPRFDRLARRLTSTDIRAGLISEGGIEMTPPLIDTVRDCLSWIRFSLDGATAAVHDRIRRVDGLFDTTTAGIRTLRDARVGTSIGINFVVQRGNMHQIGAMAQLAERLDVDVLLFKLPHGADPRHRYVPTDAEWSQIRTRVDEVLAETAGARTNLEQFARMMDDLDRPDLAAGTPVRSHYTKHGVRCHAPLFFLVIDARGDVYPCDYLQADTRAETHESWRSRAAYRVGNVFDDGDEVLDRLGTLLRDTVHGLPAAGHGECGSCTRFFQLNTSLTAGRDGGAPSPPGDRDTVPFL